jgi:hypothetical protein
MAERIERVGDLWAQLHDQPQTLAAAIARLDALLSPDDWSESMAAITRRPKPRKTR